MGTGFSASEDRSLALATRQQHNLLKTSEMRGNGRLHFKERMGGRRVACLAY